MPKFFAMRVNVRQLAPKDLSTRDIQKVFRQSKSALLRNLKDKLTQTTFSDKAKKALNQHIRIEALPKSLRVTVNHPAFYLVKGRVRKQMKWLRKANRPIPIITETGKLIFRNASARSMRVPPMTGPNVGKNKVGWIHPGRKKSDFMEKARKETREFLKEKFKKEFRRQIRTAWVK